MKNRREAEGPYHMLKPASGPSHGGGEGLLAHTVSDEAVGVEGRNCTLVPDSRDTEALRLVMAAMRILELLDMGMADDLLEPFQDAYLGVAIAYTDAAALATVLRLVLGPRVLLIPGTCLSLGRYVAVLGR